MSRTGGASDEGRPWEADGREATDLREAATAGGAAETEHKAAAASEHKGAAATAWIGGVARASGSLDGEGSSPPAREGSVRGDRAPADQAPGDVPAPGDPQVLVQMTGRRGDGIRVGAKPATEAAEVKTIPRVANARASTRSISATGSPAEGPVAALQAVVADRIRTGSAADRPDRVGRVGLRIAPLGLVEAARSGTAIGRYHGRYPGRISRRPTSRRRPRTSHLRASWESWSSRTRSLWPDAGP